MYDMPVSWTAVDVDCAARGARIAGHVSLFLADITEPGWDRLIEQSVCESERLRAARFRAAEASRRFVCGRAILRSLLAPALKRAAQDLEFEYGPTGKPRVLQPSDAHSIEFNISHSGDLLLIAIARGASVGVDVERKRTDIDVLQIARAFFTRREFFACDGADASAQYDTFYRLWTCKEACLKASGSGISEGLALEMAQVLGSDRVEIDHAQRLWTVFPLEMPAGYAAALAVDAMHPELSLSALRPNRAGAEVALA